MSGGGGVEKGRVRPAVALDTLTLSPPHTLTLPQTLRRSTLRLSQSSPRASRSGGLVRATPTIARRA